MKFEALSKFNIEVVEIENHFPKIQVDSSNLTNLFSFLKNNAEFDVDKLICITGVDLQDKIELIYDLYSQSLNERTRVSVLLNRDIATISSVVEIFNSAYFDECEIFDLLGVKFENNPNLKRLYMPNGWIGHPLRKDYVQNDERLIWNEVQNA